MSVIDTLLDAIGDKEIDRMSENLGADRKKVDSAFSAALPVLMGAVSRQAQRDEGRSIDEWAERHDDRVIGDIDGFLSRRDYENHVDGDDFINGVLGRKRPSMERGIGSASGLDTSQVSGLLKMVGPLLMGAISKQRNADGLDRASLVNLLRNDSEKIEKSHSKPGLIARFLDQDGDGDFDFADITQFVMKLFGGRRRK